MTFAAAVFAHHHHHSAFAISLLVPLIDLVEEDGNAIVSQSVQRQSQSPTAVLRSILLMRSMIIIYSARGHKNPE